MPRDHRREAMEALDEMLQRARAARRQAYAPYSGFAVGACVRSAGGNLYAGCNVENAAYPEGLCAEAAAIAAMVGAGEREIAAIAIVGGPAGGAEVRCAPCGGCRQKLHEFVGPAAGADIDVYLDADGGPVKLSALLVQAFGPKDLGKR